MIRRLLLTSAIAAFAGLAGCSGSQPPIRAPGAMPQTSALATHAERGKSWMLPEAKNEALLYVPDSAQTVQVFAYRTGKLVGTLTNFGLPAGACTDHNGDVYITDAELYDIVEYAHGGTQPIATLSENYFQHPVVCSIDPATGNLAVGNGSNYYNGYPSVAIYQSARGSPAIIWIPSMFLLFGCGYDSAGDIFVDGETSLLALEFGEIPKGTFAFGEIAVNQTISDPGTLQWDGEDVALEGYAGGTSAIYRIDGANGDVVDTFALNGSMRVGQFWIQGKKIIAPESNYGNGDVLYWKYPSGSGPIRTIRDSSFPAGATVSIEPK
jgi:hypothetical protein